MYDLLITGGRVIDPSQSIDSHKDVAITAGRVVELADHISPSLAANQVDAAGCIVTPGLIDLHTHGYWGVSHYGIDLDRYSLARGVTTSLDVGSAGAQTWLGLRHFIIEKAKSRIYAYLNISMVGMIAQPVAENEDLRYLDPVFAARIVAENRDLILGIKVRASRYTVGDHKLEPVTLAAEAARAAGVPMMVHIGDTPTPLDNILALMRSGDTLTHCFHGKPRRVLDDNGIVLPAVWDAVERGVNLDVGHGQRSFTFDTAERAMGQGLLPTVISSDIHTYSVPTPAGDLVTVMSRFLALGMPLLDVIHRVTATPAKVLGLADRLGTLRPGAEGNVTVLKLVEGEYTYHDCVGGERKGVHRLQPISVVRAGTVYSVKAIPGMPDVP